MSKIKRTCLLLSTSLALLFSTSVNAHASSPKAAIGPYIDVTDYLSGAHLEAWYDIRWKLKSNFNSVCGDTFCGGEYSNIEALRYNCSVNRDTGHIGMCAWTFAGSSEEIEPLTGGINVQKGSWRCRTPLVAGTTIEKLMPALAGNKPLYAPLPGSNQSIMDGLIDDCFF